MKIETIEIAGLAGALTALRLPFGKEVRSDIHAKIDPFIAIDNITKEETKYVAWHGHVNIHNKDQMKKALMNFKPLDDIDLDAIMKYYKFKV